MSQSDAHVEKVKAEIEKRSRAFEDAYRAGDAARLVRDYFCEDGQGPCSYPPGQKPVGGREDLTAMFAGMIKEMPNIALETVELVVADTVAFEVGLAHLTSPDGEKATGRYTVCWVEAKDGWRVKIDFFGHDGWSD